MRATISDALLRDFKLPTDATRVRVWDVNLPGFGAVVGARGAVFVARKRVAGKRRDVVIGRHGAPGAGANHGDRWTATRARAEAMRQLGAMASGVDPVARKRVAAAAAGPTLREGLAIHVGRMTKRQRSQASIDTVKKEVERYLVAWLDRPISELSGADLIALHESIKAKAKVRAHSNPANPKGGPVANRVIAHVSAIWTSANKALEGKLGNWNPAKAVDKDRLAPKRETITDLPDWCARVATMDKYPVGRDGLMLALFTGLRSEDVRTIRHEHVDVEARTLRLPDPKGGESRAFTIPLNATSLEILERRRVDNVERFGFVGGDGGWAFPAVNGKNEIIPITDLRQQLHDVDDQGKDRHTRFPVEDVHTLRRTFESIAHEEGISEIDLHVLTNHSFANHNVNASYIAQHLDHLAACTEKIEAGLLARINPAKHAKRAGRGRLRSV